MPFIDLPIQASFVLLDAATPALSYVGTLVAGVLTGAVGGAVVTSSHERAERFRERMIEAASEYLKAVDQWAASFNEIAAFVATSYHESVTRSKLSKAPFAAVVYETVGEDEIRRRVWQKLTTADVASAARQLKIVFPESPEFTASVNEVTELLVEVRDLHLPLKVTHYSEYDHSIEEFHNRRRIALTDFTDAAQKAIRRRWL